jgi:hypothetical protein
MIAKNDKAGSKRSGCFNSEDMYAIRPAYREKDRQHCGWSVAIRRNRKTYQKRFSVTRYGDLAQALAAAKAWRDEVSRSIPCITKAALSEVVRGSNTSGYPGVYLMVTKRKTPSGSIRKHWVWQARTPEEIKPTRTKSFAIAKYGDAKAFAMAVAARQEFVRELGDRPWLFAVPDAIAPPPASVVTSNSLNPSVTRVAESRSAPSPRLVEPTRSMARSIR